MVADVDRMDASDAEADTRVQAAALRSTWEGREPKAVANFFTDHDKILSSLKVDFPQFLAPLNRVTNLLVRLHKEVQRSSMPLICTVRTRV